MRRLEDAGVRVFIDERYELLPGAAVALAMPLAHGASLATGPVRLDGPDGLPRGKWTPGALTVDAVLADLRGTPPVWALAASIEIDDDPALGPLAGVDLWLRTLRAAGTGRVSVSPEPVARRSLAAPGFWEQVLADPSYAALLRRLFEKHRASLARHMDAVLIEREVGFGRMRARHRQLVTARDDAQRELDAARAAAAHHRAFLQHHRLDALDWGSFGRVDPIARDWGYARGGPVDRRYIRAFLASHASDVRGRVLEVQEDDLARAYGGCRVQRTDVIDVDRANPRATVVADLRAATSIPTDTYDCVILTQTAHVIDDMDAVTRECHRILKPGGVLLATFPCVSRVCLEYGPDGDFWRVTPAGARVLARRVFGEHAAVETFGNVKTIVAFIHGLGEGELSDSDYAVADPYNPLLVGVRAVKPAAAGGDRPSARAGRGVVLAYHRVANPDRDPFELNVSPDLFERHIRALQQHATIVPLVRLLEGDVASLPDRAVALTFDDGYAEHLDFVAPLLERLGVPATFFVPTAALRTGDEHWWDLLARVNPPDIRSWHDRFVNASLSEREQLRIDLLNLPGPSDARSNGAPVLSERGVAELARVAGMTIGAHGVNHLLLPRQPADVQEEEMRGSQRALESLVGAPVSLFAYPYGGADDLTRGIARQVFPYACDCRAARTDLSFDAAAVPRLVVGPWIALELLSRIETLAAPAVLPEVDLLL